MIRQATIDDLDNILALCRMAHQDSPYKAIALDEEHIRRLALLAITMPNFCVFLSVGSEGVTGLVVGGVNHNAFGIMTASDLITYTLKPGSGIHLYTRFLKWARQSPAELITVTNSFGNEKFDNFLRNVGLKQVGGMFIGEMI